MRSILVCILLSFCFSYFNLVSADKIGCTFKESVLLKSGNEESFIQNARAKFDYTTDVEYYTNKTTSSINGAYFMALIRPNFRTSLVQTVVKFPDIKEFRVFNDSENHGLIDERQYCAVTLLQDPPERIGVHKNMENAMRQTMLPCLQEELCESRDSVDIKGVIQNMKYRKDSEIARQKLQDSVNAASDFVLSRVVLALTNKNARIPQFGGEISYPIFGHTVNYTVYEGFFYNTANIERLMDTKLIENKNNSKVEVEVVCTLKDLNTHFTFQLSDRSYSGQIDVNITKIVFNAKITFDYKICQTKLDVFKIFNRGELEYDISQGLVWYEKLASGQIEKVVYKLITDNLQKVAEEMVSLKIQSFQCGAQKREATEAATKLAIAFGTIVGRIVKKHINDL